METRFYVAQQVANPHSVTTLMPVLKWAQGKFEKFDLSLLESVKFYVTGSWRSSTGMCYYPKRKAKYSREFIRGYRISCGIAGNRQLWPRTEQVAVGSRSIVGEESLTGLLSFDDKKRKAAARGWEYITEVVEFKDQLSELAWVAGHEAFHFLRHSKQIPGRNGEPGANRLGIEWMKDWEKTRCR